MGIFSVYTEQKTNITSLHLLNKYKLTDTRDKYLTNLIYLSK